MESREFIVHAKMHCVCTIITYIYIYIKYIYIVIHENIFEVFK